VDHLLESLELDGRANERRDTSDYDDNSVEGRRCFSRKGISFQLFLHGLIGSEQHWIAGIIRLLDWIYGKRDR
jgi:hypothetical protein